MKSLNLGIIHIRVIFTRTDFRMIEISDFSAVLQKLHHGLNPLIQFLKK